MPVKTNIAEESSQEAVYEFPSTVETKQSCQVINLRNFKKCASQEKEETASTNVREHEIITGQNSNSHASSSYSGFQFYYYIHIYSSMSESFC